MGHRKGLELQTGGERIMKIELRRMHKGAVALVLSPEAHADHLVIRELESEASALGLEVDPYGPPGEMGITVRPENKELHPDIIDDE